jgi:hypothetical protein
MSQARQFCFLKKVEKKQRAEEDRVKASSDRRDNGVLGTAAMGPAATGAAGSADR